MLTWHIHKIAGGNFQVILRLPEKTGFCNLKYKTVAMKKNYIFSCLLFLVGISTFAQKPKVDTILDMGIYQAYFSLKLKEPLYVTYTLFEGGGDCDREEEGFEFFVDEFEASADDDDYAGSGYDKGHLANAEDFAYDCEKEELTFRYYNCVPQTVRMNRGIWKTWETKIRKLSQDKELYVIAGSIFGKKKLGNDKIGVPSHCYKIVIDADTNEMIHCLVFPNNKTNTYQVVTIKELKQRLGYRVVGDFW